MLVQPTVLFVVAALFLALIDTLFLPAYLVSYLSVSQRTLSLPICIWGNLIPIVLVCSFFLAGFKYLTLWRPAKGKKAIRIVSVTAVVVGTVIYSIWLSIYTFSGAYISASPFRTVFIIGSTSLLIGLFLVTLAFTVYRNTNYRFSKTIGLCCVILAMLGVWLNHEMYPHEYGPLHTFISLWSILLSLLGFRELIGWKKVADALSTWKVACVGTGAALLSLSVLVFLSNNAMYSWIIWDATGLSRYVTFRMAPAGDEDIEDPDGGVNLIVKPDLDSFRVQAERKHRAIQPAPHIVLFVVDNLQADHVGAYGYRQKPTTPNIDALAKTGTIFENAYVSFPQTRYFSCALLLGRYFSYINKHRFPSSYVRSSILRLLKQRGYHTFVRAWFEESMEKDFNPADYKIDRYFRPLYANHPLNDKGLVDWAKLSEKERLDTVEAHLNAADKKGVPGLIWIHAVRPHWAGKRIQFKSSKRFRFGRGMRNHYDSAVAATDDWYGRMKSMIEKRRSGREVVWIVGSDHGAGLGRFKGGTGKTLYDVHTRVPLIISAPGFNSHRVSTLVDAPLDLASTVLDFAGIPIPREYDGISLLPLMLGTEAVDRFVPLIYGRSWIGAVYRNWKLIRLKNAATLFDLSNDPKELRNIADKHPGLVKELSRFSKSVLRKRFPIQ